MIRPLRERHFQVWVLLAFLLPAALILAVINIPKPVYNLLIHPVPSEIFPNIIGTREAPGYVVHLRTNNKHDAVQLEWISKEPSTLPVALIYQGQGVDSMGLLPQSNLVGRIDAMGIYHFTLGPDLGQEHLHFLIYDIIHHRIVDRFNF